MCELIFWNIFFDVLFIVHFLLVTVLTYCSYTSIEHALPYIERLVDCCVNSAYIRLICSNEWGVTGFIQVFLYITAVLDVIYGFIFHMNVRIYNLLYIWDFTHIYLFIVYFTRNTYCIVIVMYEYNRIYVDSIPYIFIPIRIPLVS